MRPRPESATRPSTSSTVATRTRPKLIRTSTRTFSQEAAEAGASYAGPAGGRNLSVLSAAPTEEPALLAAAVSLAGVVARRRIVLVVARTEGLGVDDGPTELGEERIVLLGLVPPARLVGLRLRGGCGLVGQ